MSQTGVGRRGEAQDCSAGLLHPVVYCPAVRKPTSAAGGPLVVPCGKQRLKVLGGLGADGRVKAARRAPEGLGLDATGCPATLAKGLSANGFLAGNPDGRGRLAPFPLAGRAGGRVTAGGCECERRIPHETA